MSFLHVYHHSAMLLLSDYAFRITPWPAMVFILAMNSLVHVLVYAYYFVAAANFRIPLWAKQALTVLQIVQFLLGLCYCFWGYVYYGFCVYSLIFGSTILALFMNFYLRTYVWSKKRGEISNKLAQSGESNGSPKKRKDY